MVKILTIKKITIPKRIRELVWKKNIGKKEKFITANLRNFKSILKLNSYENKDDINKLLSTLTNKNSELFNKNKEDTTKLVSELISKNKDLISKDNEIAFEKMKNILPQDLIEGMKDYFIKNKTSAYKGKQGETKIEKL